MARIRTIKPEFWTDSFMVQLPPIARLIYIALWTAADDHGLLADEPDRLAMEVMPREDPLVFDDWFQFFEASGRIELLADNDGATYYQIGKWSNHQRVDKPSKSRIAREGSRKVAIPLPVRRKVAEKYGCSPGEQVDACCYYCGLPGSVHWHKLSSGRPSAWVTFPGLELDHLEAENNGGENEAENIVLACRGCNRSKGTKDWIEHLCTVNKALDPRISVNPREDSCTEGNREQGTGKGKEEPPNGGLSKAGDKSPPVEPAPCPHQEIVDAYHELLPSLRRVRDWTPERQAFLRARWREATERQSVDWWRKVFTYVGKSDFLMGRESGAGRRAFDCDLEWIVRPKNLVKILEGKYHRSAA